MKIGIIGAGFAGLTASFRLAKHNNEVTLFETSSKPGGLASGFTKNGWDWSVDEHYHHWFTNDRAVLNLAKEIGYKLITKKVKTSIYYQGIHKFDSPLSLLSFNKLSVLDRLRIGLVTVYLKATPLWKPLEKITAKKFLIKWMGNEPWRILWEPLFKKKFGKFAAKIPASWFWARIKKRTLSLSYPVGGYLKFAEEIDARVTKSGGQIHYNERVLEIQKKGQGITITTNKGVYLFDKVICTLPNAQFISIVKGLGSGYFPARIKKLKSLGAITLLLILKGRYLEDGTYWLNINDPNYPFLMIAEHTNFIQKSNYSGYNLVYVGNYLESTHPYFSRSAKELLDIYLPYLLKINPGFSKETIQKVDVFKADFAQPIIPLNYSKSIPPFKTPIKGLYLINTQQVYPWDRGTNYAVKIGEEVSRLIIEPVNR